MISISTATTTGGIRTPLPLTQVTITDRFWAPRRELIRTKTLRQQHEQMRSKGQFDALKLNWGPGDPTYPTRMATPKPAPR
jgi:hypothetical protein